MLLVSGRQILEKKAQAEKTFGSSVLRVDINRVASANARLRDAIRQLQSELVRGELHVTATTTRLKVTLAAFECVMMPHFTLFLQVCPP